MTLRPEATPAAPRHKGTRWRYSLRHMDRHRLGKIFSMGLALAEAACNADHAAGNGTAEAPSGEPADSAPSSLVPSSMAPARSAPTATAAATDPAPSASAAPAGTDAEVFLAGLQKIDMTLPAALGKDVELVGFVVRRDGEVLCDPAPCASAWSSLLPSTADHAIVKKAGKLVAVSKATFASVVGPIETPAAAAARARLEVSLAVCKAVGRDDVVCKPTNAAVAYHDGAGPEGVTIATYAPTNTCPYGGWPVAGSPPTDVGVRFVRVAPDGKITAAPHPLAERLTAAQRARNKPECRSRVVKGRAYQGFRHHDAGATELAYYVRAAREEAAAVVAFERLARELASFGAPAELTARARRAADDERRHAALFAGEARALATRLGVPLDPAPLEPCAAHPRALEAVLTENAVEGCANETYAAVMATHQALHTPLTHLRAALAALAADERDHAALAFDVHAWGRAVLDPATAARVDAARVAATKRLALQPEDAGDVARAMGEPDAHVASRAFAHVAATLAA